MKNIIEKNFPKIEIVKNLLIKEVPTYRQTYSDRTSWLMSCFSELAYLRLTHCLSTTNKSILSITI
jgi:triacylglycerol lipase